MSNEGRESVKQALLAVLRKRGTLTKARFVSLGIPRRDVESMIKNGILVQEYHPTKVLYKVPDDDNRKK